MEGEAVPRRKRRVLSQLVRLWRKGTKGRKGGRFHHEEHEGTAEELFKSMYCNKGECYDINEELHKIYK